MKDAKNSIKIKRNSLRGDNLFVQMAQCKIDSLDEYSILEEYAYDRVEDALTLDKKIGILHQHLTIKRIKEEKEK